MRQRTVLGVTLVGLVIGSVATAQPAANPKPATAASLVAQGTERAKAEGKLLMVEFTAQWCGWCHQYERFLGDTVAGVGKIMRDNFVIVPLVVEDAADRNNEGSQAMLDGYTGGRNGGIPFYAFLDANGKLLGTSNAMTDGSNIGHPAKETEFDAYDALLARVAPRITAAERVRIRDYLRAMQAK